MKVPKSIFRLYDIRGIYPNELSEDTIEFIGKAFGTFLLRKLDTSVKIVVGRDSRESSPVLTKRFIEGLLSTGCDVVDIGVSLTPIVHYLTCVEDLGFSAGVEVTASHNPKEFNGLRLDYNNATPFYGDDILKLHTLVENEDFESGDGSMSRNDSLAELYIDHLSGKFSFEGKLKVIVDCGYGTTSYFIEELLGGLGCDVEGVYCKPDSSFPLGTPDPERDSFMEDLGRHVVESGADLGLAFDEDGDRFGIVDEKGSLYDNDYVLLLFAKYFLKTHGSGTILYDVKSSGLVGELVAEWGGKPEMLRTGHPYFVQQMREGALLGGEFSGHMYFANNFGYDDGIYAACAVIDLLESSSKSLSEKMAEFPKRHSSPEIKIKCSDEKKFDIVEQIESDLVSEYDNIVTVDGVRVQVTKTGWFLIRASNTSPYLSVRIEGESEDEVDELLDIVTEILSKFDSLDMVT